MIPSDVPSMIHPRVVLFFFRAGISPEFYHELLLGSIQEFLLGIPPEVPSVFSSKNILDYYRSFFWNSPKSSFRDLVKICSEVPSGSLPEETTESSSEETYVGSYWKKYSRKCFRTHEEILDGSLGIFQPSNLLGVISQRGQCL